MRSRETRIGIEPAHPSSIASSMPVSRIREVMELAWKDPEVIHLEVGEPDFPTPEHIVEAAHEAARSGHTRYAPCEPCSSPATRCCCPTQRGRTSA